jgi:hypothetical protein
MSYTRRRDLCLHLTCGITKPLISADFRRPRNNRKALQESSVRHLLPAESGISPEGPQQSASPLSQISHDLEQDGDQLIPFEANDTQFQSKLSVCTSDPGRLFVSQGKARYIDGQKANKVATLERILSELQIEDDGSKPAAGLGPSPPSQQKSQPRASTLLSSQTSSTVIPNPRPSPTMMRAMWKYYIENVDVLLKILYRPTVEDLVAQKCSKPHLDLETSSETLLLGIMFATVMTMSGEECQRLLGQERGPLASEFRASLEQALNKNGWMTTQDITVLQGFILFLVFLFTLRSQLSKLTGEGVLAQG